MTVLFIGSMITSNVAVVLLAEKPAYAYVAEEVLNITSDGELIISGDPIVAILSERLQVPELTNLAEVKYPFITSDELIYLTEQYHVRTVVLTYNLSSMNEYVAYVREHFEFHAAYAVDDGELAVARTPGVVNITEETYTIYHRPDIWYGPAGWFTFAERKVAPV